jgi:hypothetical protein
MTRNIYAKIYDDGGGALIWLIQQNICDTVLWVFCAFE